MLCVVCMLEGEKDLSEVSTYSNPFGDVCSDIPQAAIGQKEELLVSIDVMGRKWSVRKWQI